MSASEYELVLMLDPESEDEQRDKIASDARARIESGGRLKTEKVWGLRKLAYEIQKRNEADYRFFRFETESPLLDELNHNLRITDGVLRFRIFKVDPDSPVIEPGPPMSLASAAPSRGPGGRGRGGSGGGRGRDDNRGRGDDSSSAPPAVSPPAAAPAPAQPADAPAPATDAPAPSEPTAAPEAPAATPEPVAAPEAPSQPAPAAE